jgi:hypothetical protein
MSKLNHLKRDPELVEAIFSHDASPQRWRSLRDLILANSVTHAGIRQLERHLPDFDEAAVLPPAWRPLLMEPASTYHHLIRRDDTAAFETIGLLQHVNTAKAVDEEGYATPFALAAQNFLGVYQKIAGMAIRQGLEHTIQRRRVVSFLAVVERDRRTAWTTTDVYHGVIKLLQLTKPGALEFGNVIFDRINEGLAGLASVDEELDDLLNSYFLIYPYYDLFHMRAIRSPLLLSAELGDLHRQFRAAQETVSILRMIQLSTGKAVQPKLKDYAASWLDALFFEAKPLRAHDPQMNDVGRNLMANLKTLYRQKQRSV